MCLDSEDDGNLTNEEILIRTDESLDWMFGDITYAYENDANVGAAILTVLAIDCFAARRCGHTSRSHPDAGEAFDDFVKNYLLKVNGEYSRFLEKKPYGNLRSALVHRYTKKGFDFERDCSKHLIEEDGYLHLDIESFAQDARAAIDLYLISIKQCSDCFSDFKKSYVDSPLVGQGVKGKPSRRHS